MKGDELLHQIHVIAPKTLKIMLTGQADMEAVTNAVNDASLYRYIAKPWEKTDLILTVKEALHKYFQNKTLEEQHKILQNVNHFLEQQVKERTAELEAQKSELTQKNVQLKELNASKDKFFSIISHDLRNPFNILLGFARLTEENIDRYSKDDIKQHVGRMRSSAERLYALIENLLMWSQIQRGVMEYLPESINLHEIVLDTIELLKPQAEQKQIILSMIIQENMRVYADPGMIDIVIRNLTSNALKFTGVGGSVSLSARQEKQHVEVSVSDTGVGIPEEDIPQLFQIDTQYTNPGTDGEKGTGLGLILCKELIEKNYGKIWVESEVGKGTTFRFTLPKVPEKVGS
jgi:signal transduction histidine kinase